MATPELRERSDPAIGGRDDVVAVGIGANVLGQDLYSALCRNAPGDCGGGDDRAVLGSTDTATRCEVVILRDLD